MAGAHSAKPRRRHAASPSRRWFPSVIVSVLALVLLTSGYVVAANVDSWRAQGDYSPAAALTKVDGASAMADAAAQRTQERVEVREEKERQALIRREAKAARQLAARQAKAKAERKEKRRVAALRGTPYTFKIGSFNVLGSQHTAPGGQRSGFPSASVRTGRAASLARAHGVDILGTQELQGDQLAGLTANTGMKAWPGTAWGARETMNSILYDPAVFEYVSGASFNITFMSRSRPQPILRLRHIETTRELYVINAHPSAGGGKYAGERDRGHATIASVVNRLQSEGLPVLVTGDMNDRERFYCNVVAKTALTAPNGGGAGCAPPPGPLPVDWVVGSGVSWSGYHRDTTPVTQRTSDHFFISATATVS